MLYIPTMWYYDISVTYFAGFQSVKFVIIPHVLFSKNFCEILLYNPPLVVLTDVFGIKTRVKRVILTDMRKSK